MVRAVNQIAILIGIFFISFGLVPRYTGLCAARRNSRYSPAEPSFWLLSVGVIIILDGVFL